MINAKQIIRAAILVVCAAAVASCSRDGMEVDTPGGGTSGLGGDITFDIGFAPATRVSTDADFTSEWEAGDAIGIFACENGTTLSASGNHFHNVRLTYSGGSWSLDNGVELWFPTAGRKLDFYAYYPYDDNGGTPEDLDPTAIAFNVLKDQSGTTGTGAAERLNYNLSDLLTAKSDNGGSGWGKGQTVSLQFTHALAMVEVTLDNTVGAIDRNEELTVTLRGVKLGATLNLAEAMGPKVDLATTDNEAIAITMYRVEQKGTDEYRESYTFRALVPAQDLNEGNRVALITNGKLMLQSSALKADITLKAAQAEQFTQKLPYHVPTVDIPAGTFLMGSSDGSNIGNGDGSGLNTTSTEPNRQSNETQHSVTLTQDFHMSKYPVTFAQYDAFCDAKGRTKPSDQGWGRGDRPVINVSWNDAVAFCDWLTETTGLNWRLPTEAEWEYACRGGRSESLPFGIGDGKYLDGDMANIDGRYIYNMDDGGHKDMGSGSGTYLSQTTPVGQYDYPNGYGLYDMHGNVWEWCADWYASYDAMAVIDPTGPDSGTYRVMRGGGYGTPARNCRSAYRNYDYPTIALSSCGFRVVFVP